MIGCDDGGKCRLCGQYGHKTVLSAQKTEFDDAYSLNRCLSCGFVSVAPLPTAEMLGKYYSNEYWQPPKQNSHDIVDKLYQLRMRSVLNRIQNYFPQGGNVLDWGAGNGAWVRFLQKIGYEALGIDQYAVNPESNYLINGDIKTVDLKTSSFDVITCFHVLEHLPDPVESFKAALDKLKPKGLMVIEVPNIDSWGFRVFGSKWQPLEIPTHLNHFNLATLNKLIESSRQAEIVQAEFFSFRASPASLVLSLFPCLTPRKVRACHSGSYPIPYKLAYLLLQIGAMPISLAVGALRKGSIMRLTIMKR